MPAVVNPHPPLVAHKHRPGYQTSPPGISQALDSNCAMEENIQESPTSNQVDDPGDRGALDPRHHLALMAPELQSRVEETLATCPRFRIVLVGNPGVGKSSLFNYVFNITDYNETSIDDRGGKPDITHGHCFEQNARVILHESKGLEPGSAERDKILKVFLQAGAHGSAELPDQVHAIWFCIETPCTGSRSPTSGHEALLDLAEQLRIPIIVVFTKYDLLVAEHYRACSHISSQSDRTEEAEKRAGKDFHKVTKQLGVPCVPISMKENYRGTMLLKLTEVTKDHLRDVSGSLWVAAQQINAHQKVELSISGFKKYCRDLGERSSMFVQGHPLDCITRIHDDVLKVWNFNDPLKLLSGVEFLKGMIDLVEPLRDAQQIHDPLTLGIALAANVVSVAGAIGSGVILPALILPALIFPTIIGTIQKSRTRASETYLAAYMVDLTLVLHRIAMAVRADSPRSLSMDLVKDTLATYKPESARIHEQVKEVASSPRPESVAKVIRDALHM